MSCCQGSIILWLDHECHLAKSGFPKFMSPLSLWREDSFITLDLNEIFSVLTQNFAFLPQKLIVSHGQGFRVSSYLWSSINIFAVDKVLLTVWSVWWWSRFLLKRVIHWLMALYISDTLYHLSVPLLWVLWVHKGTHFLPQISRIFSAFWCWTSFNISKLWASPLVWYIMLITLYNFWVIFWPSHSYYGLGLEP